MAKATNRTADRVVTRTAGGSTQPLTAGAVTVTEHDVARRAFELYLAGGRAHGRDVEDWLQAERELK